MRTSIGILIVALAVGGLAVADPAQGEVRSVQARDGAALREVPKPLGKRVAVLPYGTRVRVTETQTYWAHVSTDAGVEGWMRGEELVAPSALTGGGAGGPVGEGRVATADVTAAGRQFDSGTEGQYRASSAQLDAAFKVLDGLEKKGPAAGSEEVEKFVVEGRLGKQP